MEDSLDGLIEKSLLRILAPAHRCHFIKVRARVHHFSNGHLAVFYGPRKLTDDNANGSAAADPGRKSGGLGRGERDE